MLQPRELLPEEVTAGLQLPTTSRSRAQQAAIAAYALRKHVEQRLAALPPRESVYAVSRYYSHSKKLKQPMATPKVVHVLRRGSIDQPGEVAAPGALSAVDALSSRFRIEDLNEEAARRASLADWLAAAENPLTWRSIVNRVWSHHFGRGICDTPSDFGRMGGVPTHPELLDWLAVWFRDDANGSLKELHRLILLSETWQRQTQPPPGNVGSSAQNKDAENRLLWRMNRRRIDAESYRDSLLRISGRIDMQMGGPGIQQFKQSKGPQATPKLYYDAFAWDSPEAARRSIYRVVWRGIQDPFMESMDFPDMALLSPKREFSVSALQALSVFNNDFVLVHSDALANRLRAEVGSLADQIRHACRLIYLREPTGAEQAAFMNFAKKHGLAALCRVLFNSNEFLFIE